MASIFLTLDESKKLIGFNSIQSHRSGASHKGGAWLASFCPPSASFHSLTLYDFFAFKTGSKPDRTVSACQFVTGRLGLSLMAIGTRNHGSRLFLSTKLMKLSNTRAGVCFPCSLGLLEVLQSLQPGSVSLISLHLKTVATYFFISKITSLWKIVRNRNKD